MSIIAIDYDNTYSTHKEEFTTLREMFQSKGHKVFIVTARDEKLEPINDDLSGFDAVFYTSGLAKASVVRADIWCDDSPVTLCNDFVPGQAHATPAKALHQGYKDTHVLWNFEGGKFVSYVTKTLGKHGTKEISNTKTTTNKELSNAISGVLDKNSRAYFDSLQIGSFVESEGGYYTGLIRSDYDQKLYALFLAPKDVGDNFGNTMKIHSHGVAITGTDYLSDGWANTKALGVINGDPSYAGGWSRSLDINDKTDWYVPSRDELEMCYSVFKPDTTANSTSGANQNGDANCMDLSGGSGKNLYSVPVGAKYTASVPAQTSLTEFRTGGTQAFQSGYYWSSTQRCSDTSYLWVQGFGDGRQSWVYKTNGYYVRAVRRVLVQE